MKTAISIPDEIFQEAEQLARRLGVSRSELYVKAVKNYINIHKHQYVTKKLNEVYGSTESSVDDEITSIQFRSIQKGDYWD